MSDAIQINSSAYWQGRFSVDWETCAGPAQSRFFARLAMDNLPRWLLEQLSREGLTVCDWGCAQGDGTDVLAGYMDPRRLTGVDFSSVAVEQAARRYPAIGFLNEDWLSSDGDPQKRFDLVFSSNTLEHFHEPYKVLSVLCRHARKGLVLVLPYRELERIGEHFFTFLPNNIPLLLANGFRLMWSRVVDCRSHPDASWAGDQIVLVYADRNWVDLLGLTLSDCEVAQEDARADALRLASVLDERATRVEELGRIIAEREGRIAGLNDVLAERNDRIARLTETQVESNARIAKLQQQLSERDERLAVLDQTLADLEAKGAELTKTQTQTEGLLQLVLGSRSWRLTKPIRFATRLARHRVIGPEDRRRLIEVMRRAYRAAPLPEPMRRGIRRVLADRLQRSAPPPLPPYLNLPPLSPAEAPGPSEPRQEPQGGPGTQDARVASVVRAISERRYRVLCLPVIDWDFRFQRPQQLMTQFAGAGHEVIYVSLSFGARLSTRRLEERIQGVTLPGPIGLNPYQNELNPEQASQMAEELVLALALDAACPLLCLVQLPFWSPLAAAVQGRTGCRIVYDCMDDHSGFSTNRPAMLASERALIGQADLVVASSAVLAERLGPLARRSVLIRNACDLDHFKVVGPRPGRDGGAPRIGYFGAIADWFDVSLVADLARARPAWRFELIGSTFSADTSPLDDLPNIALLGERPYADLPRLMQAWDCCIIPFLRGPLTEATNPVKVYEMLAAGKPVVAVPLPELVPLAEQGLIRLGRSAGEFASEIEEALASETAEAVQVRRDFAAENTWSARFEALDPEVRQLWPLASVVVTTFHNLEMNRLCLGSVLGNTNYPNLEVIVVDNASEDGTCSYLAELARAEGRLRVLYNAENRGFAGAYNQGLGAAQGEYLCLLNNDTVVTPWWLTALIGALQRSPDLGLVGPVTNAIDNEAKVQAGYGQVDEMSNWAAQYCARNQGQVFPIPMLAFFCVAMPRSVFERVGPLDERFEKGMFEDNDYCRRVRGAGLELACARDSFVHHWQRASFNLLGEETYLKTFYENRDAFQRKWMDFLPDAEGGARSISPAEVAQRIREAETPAVVFAPSIGWNVHLFQRPQHLAIALAALGHVVIFDVSNAGDPVEGFKEIAPRLFLYRGDPAVLRGLPDLLIWTFSYNYGYRDYFFPSTPAIYDWIDDLEVFPFDQAALTALHERALGEASVVACVAKVLMDQALASRPDALYLPNAVEYERFAEARIVGSDIHDPELAKFLGRSGPLCGYYGALAEWFDYRLLTEVARQNPQWRFLLIGPDYDGSIKRAGLKRVRNVHWAGPKDYASLPAYLARFDVAMIPFVINDITRATSPLKLYEYFAGGKPVVCTPMPECMAYPEVRIVEDAAGFSAALEEARVRGQDPVFRERMRELGRRNSWRARAEDSLARFEESRSRGR